MAACKCEFPTRHAIPETTGPTQAFMTQHARFLIPCTHTEELPIFWQNKVPPLITCILSFADLYLLQFREKQVDIVHRIYLPDKVFCVFQKCLKWTRVLPLTFWTIRTCMSSIRINSETLSGRTGWRKCQIWSVCTMMLQCRTAITAESSTTYTFEHIAQWIQARLV